MCDVVFITPNMTGDITEESLGTLQLAAILKNQGVSCDIVRYIRTGNLHNFEAFLDACMRMLEARKPKIVSFYTRVDVWHVQLRIAQLVKEKWPDVYVVFGGPQSDITAEETIKSISWVDFICCGEGENTIYPFFTSLLRGEPDLTVPGLVYRKDGQVVKNPRPQMIMDLDQLPMPDYSLFSFDQDQDRSTVSFPIDVGRGCPFQCTFCSTSTFWGRSFRLKSPQRIFREIKEVCDKYGMTRFSLSHDMFTFDKKQVREVCRLIKTLDYPIQWGCSARADCIDRDLIDVMADAGMVGIFLGIETGSPRMQKLIRKNLKLDAVMEIVAYLTEKGIKTTASFVYGFPEETEADLSQTMELIVKLQDLKSVEIQTHMCTFLAGTELSERYKDQMLPIRQCTDITGEFGVEECQDLIRQYPQLFRHMLEYRSELRDKLVHFSLFFFVWNRLQPVYRYLYDKYPRERVVDMYYDFRNANQEALDHLENAPENGKSLWISMQDKLPARFADDENYDLISDYMRYYQMIHSEAAQNGQTVSDVFCFDPVQIGKVPLQEFTRCLCQVTIIDGKITRRVFNL